MKITRQDTLLPLKSEGVFNRYMITYTASIPLRCSITYTEQGRERTEEFFLEAGENTTFASYMDGYLRHMTADAVVSMTVRSISHDEGDFELLSFGVEAVPVLAEKTFFFENERYRVGVELCWGGGLSYLEDKTCPVEGNLTPSIVTPAAAITIGLAKTASSFLSAVPATPWLGP